MAAAEGPFPPVTAVDPRHAPDHPFSRFWTLSPPDCVDASSMATHHGAGPVGVTYMRVEHIGDPGTDELLHEVDHEITWQLSYYTGLQVPPSAQRGYRDRFGDSGFQMRCEEAGFFMNSATFSHTQAIVGEGPNVSVGRDFDPGFALFERGASVVVEADVRAPALYGPARIVDEGTAQLSFYVYYHDRTTVTAVAQLVGLLDNRAAGVNGSGVEWAGNDGHTAFICSPLAEADSTGAAVRFATPLPGSASMQFERGWGESRHLGFSVSPAQFSAALAHLRAQGASISGDPADYVVTAVGVLGEIFPGTGHDHEVALGASLSGLALRESPLLGIYRP